MKTRTMDRAVEWLHERGGSGVLNRQARLIAGSEVSEFGAATWLRLVVAGSVVVRVGGRLELSQAAGEEG